MIKFINKNQIIGTNCENIHYTIKLWKMYDVLFMSKNILRFPVIKIQ